MHKAHLVLEDGSIFDGERYGVAGVSVGELVFATGMTGYQETLTDPSYAGQIVMQTFPHIGIVGTNVTDAESSKIWVAGYIVREPSRIASNHRSEKTLDQDLIENNIVGISNVDTRAITLHVRSLGAMRAGIFSSEQEMSTDEMLALVRAAPEMKGQSLSGQVSTSISYLIPSQGKTVGKVAVLDLGIKKSTLEHLAMRGLEIEVFPADISAAEIMATSPDGFFFSNGPGRKKIAGPVAVFVAFHDLKINALFFVKPEHLTNIFADSFVGHKNAV